MRSEYRERNATIYESGMRAAENSRTLPCDLYFLTWDLVMISLLVYIHSFSL